MMTRMKDDDEDDDEDESDDVKEYKSEDSNTPEEVEKGIYDYNADDLQQMAHDPIKDLSVIVPMDAKKLSTMYPLVAKV